jgi:hypothetical protein
MLTTAHHLVQRLRRPARRKTVLLSLSGVLVGLAGIVTPTLVPAASAVTAHSSHAISYQLGWITNTEFAGTYLAQSQGYDAANGLKVTILPGGSDPVEPVIEADGDTGRPQLTDRRQTLRDHHVRARAVRDANAGRGELGDLVDAWIHAVRYP